MNLITLDLATRFGWTAGPIQGRPTWGHVDLGGSGRAFGRRNSVYKIWLEQAISEHAPDEIVYEKPIVAGRSTLESLFMTIGLAAITEEICWERDVRCLWIDNKKAKHLFAGTGNATKDDMVQAARDRGFRVAVHDEADALALRYVRLCQIAPDAALALEPLFGQGQTV